MRNEGGKIWTAAGVSAGIDMALAFIAERAGEEVAADAQLYAEYYPSRRVYKNTRVEKLPKYLTAEARQKLD